MCIYVYILICTELTTSQKILERSLLLVERRLRQLGRPDKAYWMSSSRTFLCLELLSKWTCLPEDSQKKHNTMTRRCMRIHMYENTPCHSRFWEWAKGFSIIHRNAYVFVRSGWGPASGFVGVQGMCNKHLPKWDLWRFGIPGYDICLLFEWVVPHLELALTLTTFLNNKLVFSGLCLLSFGLVWVVAWSHGFS